MIPSSLTKKTPQNSLIKINLNFVKYLNVHLAIHLGKFVGLGHVVFVPHLYDRLKKLLTFLWVLPEQIREKSE